jgi:hypothetical protein
MCALRHKGSPPRHGGQAGAVKKPPCRQTRATTDRTTQRAIYPEIRPVSESARARSAPRFGPSEASLVRRREVGWVRVCHFCGRIDRACGVGGEIAIAQPSNLASAVSHGGMLGKPAGSSVCCLCGYSLHVRGGPPLGMPGTGTQRRRTSFGCGIRWVVITGFVCKFGIFEV